MKSIHRGAVVALLASILPPVAAEPVDPEAVRRLVDASAGNAEVGFHRATGAARFIRLAPGSLPLAGNSPVERSSDFFEHYGDLFGMIDPVSELSAPTVRADRYGFTHLSYRQLHEGVPVFAGTVRTHFDSAGRITAVNGTFVPEISVDPRPALEAAEAAETAVRYISRESENRVLEGTAHATRLVVFRSGLLQRVEGRDHLVFEVEVTNGADLREFVYVDAHTGKIVERITGIHEALDRKIHEPDFNDVVIWMEGDSLPYSTGDPTNDDQVNGLIDFSADVYDLFSNLSGGSFLSWDGADGTMHSVWKPSQINCPNATWNGTTTNYCDGVASDDVVAHEWAHGYTSSTHDLIYQWQPGALNEAYSDIFGEVVDLLNAAGTDSPSPLRTAGDCSTFGGNPPPSFVVNSPVAIAGSYIASGANFNPDPPIAATADVELVDDGDDEGGSASVTDACQNLVGFTSGNIALIDRGDCSFASKVLRAQNAGAVGVIMVNSFNGTFTMGGSEPSITIPSVMISQSDGDAIKNELGSGPNASISLAEATAGSYRWLMGEDSFSFGGAIRDLWNPNCFGDPAKVSDVQYQCATFDGGGVHTNSGVPNHAFALLVDGGTFNGHTVTPLGLTKATHLYWRAMEVYQVEDSGFEDHVDALAQSCTDLLGVDLADLSTGAASGEMIDAADCNEVADAMLAVEMADPPGCTFLPLLDPNAPSLVCPTRKFLDDFESDPTGVWTLSNSGVYAEYTPRDWEWTSDVPPGGSGSAFFALDDRHLGNCTEGDDDQSGMMSLDSPPITLTDQGTLAFDHYVATEFRFDGGNLKISVNGGAFQLIAADDFTFNAYNDTLETAEEENTNPMAGEPAFTGSDGGVVTGSWGQSQVDLGTYAGAGDTIRLRFDFGVDGCNGLDGWYLDNVTVCTADTPAGAVLPATPLVLDKAIDDQITLSWGASCLAGDSDYEIYEGTIGDFESHSSKFCNVGDVTKTFDPQSESSYYLVVPRTADREGSYGSSSDDVQRQQGGSACLPQAIAVDCS